MALGSQLDALVVGESETRRTDLLSKDAILGLEIINHLALLLVDPAGQSDEEEPHGGDTGIIEGSLSKRSCGVIQAEDSQPAGQIRSLDRVFGQNAIRVNNEPCVVMGVLEVKGQSAVGQDQDDQFLMPYTTVMKTRGSDTVSLGAIV